MTDLLTLPIFGNSMAAWSLAAAIFLATVSLLAAARAVARKYHDRARRTERLEVMEIPLGVVARTNLLFVSIVALYLGVVTLEMGPQTRVAFNSVATIALFWQAGLWAAAATRAWLAHRRASTLATDRAAAGSLGIIAFIAQGAIWTMVVLLTLENVGVDITALVAGLGIGGVAVALAMQNILGDLFASLSITFDRPFVVGDFLIVGETLGSVEHIGVKSTRLRSLSGEQIVLSNADLLNSRLRNYGRMSERRVVFTTGVAYETPIELLEQIPSVLRASAEAQQGIRFDRSHLARHAAASIEFETVYYVLCADYNRYMDIQQAINLRIHREFVRLGVQFAYPTQRLLLEMLRQPEETSRSAA